MPSIKRFSSSKGCGWSIACNTTYEEPASNSGSAGSGRFLTKAQPREASFARYVGREVNSGVAPTHRRATLVKTAKTASDLTSHRKSSWRAGPSPGLLIEFGWPSFGSNWTSVSWTDFRAPPSSRGAPPSPSNLKELVDLGIFVTLLVLIEQLSSLPIPVRRGKGSPISDSNRIFQIESLVCILKQPAIREAQ